jgi:hypothetical protein
MVSPTLYLVPVSNEQATAHLEETVIDGVDPNSVPHPLEHDPDRLHIWGTKEKTAKQQSFERGDILLFYTGDKTYTQAAAIRETTIDEEIARELYGIDDTDVTKDREPWSHIIYLDAPIEVEIKGSKIADYADYGMDYVLGLQSLNDEGHNNIRAEYESLPAFLITHSDWSERAVYDASPLLQEIATGETTNRTALDPSDIVSDTPLGLEVASRWDTRRDHIASILDRTSQAVLTGPAYAVSLGQAHRFSVEWLSERHPDRDADSRILSASIDAQTTYDDFVEHVYPSTTSTDRLRTTDGPFKQACRLAHAAKNEATYEGEQVPEFVLLLDVEPGVSVTDVLGQVSHLLDPSNRRREPTIQLPHSGETLHLPSNLNILVITEQVPGQSLPTQLQRYFRIVDFPVDLDLLSQVYGFDDAAAACQRAGSGNAEFAATTVAALRELNTHLTATGDEPLRFGQDLFIDYSHDEEPEPGQYADTTLLDIWQHTLLPHLRAETSDHETELAGIFDDLSVTATEFRSPETVDRDQFQSALRSLAADAT